MTTPIYGIDLGTTYTKCALVSPHDGVMRVLKLDKESSSASNNTMEVLRSAVSLTKIDEAKVAYVGLSAWTEFASWDADIDPPYKCIEEAKLWMGENLAESVGDKPPWPFEPHGWEYRQEDIGALVLRKVKKEALAQRFPAIERIVVTHPQNFTESRREATRQAVYIAGLEVVDTLTEPDAAAIAYGLEMTPGRYMVFDLGGGTLDITIANINRGKCEVITSDGIREGGRDWDRRIFDHMVQEYSDAFPGAGFGREFIDDRTLQLWMRAAEQVKWQLTNADAGGDPPARVKIECKNNEVPYGMPRPFVLKRSEFERMTQGLVDDCRTCAERTLANKNLSWSDLNGVLLVGGSTRLRAIRRMLEEASGKPLNTQIDASTVVAIGAALYAHSKAQKMATSGQVPASLERPSAPGTGAAAIATTIEHKGVLARGLGVKAWDGRNRRNVIVNLIRKDSQIPRTEERQFVTTADNQTQIPVELWEGDSDDPGYCEKVGECVLMGIPPAKAGQPVRVRIEIQTNGSKHISVFSGGMFKDQVIQFDEQRVLPTDDLEARRAFIESVEIR